MVKYAWRKAIKTARKNKESEIDKTYKSKRSEDEEEEVKKKTVHKRKKETHSLDPIDCFVGCCITKYLN